MKRELFSVLAVGCSILTVSCGSPKTLTIKYHVPVYEGGQIVRYDEVDQIDTTTIFENAITPSASKVSGLAFLGWYVEQEFNKETYNPDLLYKGGGLVHYNEVVSYSKDGVVNLYGTYGVKDEYIIKHDFVVAYYGKDTTSGCTEDVMNKFTADMKTYLESKNLPTTDIVVKGYSGAVDTSCGAIIEDYDKGLLLPNIMIGWKGNLTFSDQGDIHPTTEISGIQIGSKADRRIHSLAYDGVTFSQVTIDIQASVLEWLNTDDGKASLLG